jgi:chromosomal replication initiator protein
MDEKQRIWNSVLGEIELNVSKTQFNTWIKNTYILSMDDHEIVVCVPNSFTRGWLLSKFNTTIMNSIQSITGSIHKVRYVVKDPKIAQQQTASVKKIVDLKDEKKDEKQSVKKPESTKPKYSDTGLLNPKYIFETFIEGSSNELAYAAARNVAKEPGIRYNPLFIYGGVGLGKTHLIQAVGNTLLKSGKKVRYITSDTFISELMNAFQTGSINQFKQKHRSVDVLIIDDIQFIAGKEKTQEEVFNTFNELYAHNKQIIITSDRPPNAIKALNDRLKSRFEGGMIADVVLPDFEMRVAILKQKSLEKNFDVSDEILKIIAERVKSNVRELEGALNKIIARVQLLNTTVTKEMVDKIIVGGQMHTQRTINENIIMEIVGKHFNVTEEELLSKSRKKDIAYPRQILMYLLREDLKLTFPNIGQIIGGRDHTTVMHAYDKIKKGVAGDYAVEQEVTMIRNKLYNEE